MVIHADGHPLPLLARSLERLLSGEFDGHLREMEEDLRKAMRPMTPEETRAHTAFLVKISRPIRKVYDLGATHQGVNKQGE